MLERERRRPARRGVRAGGVLAGDAGDDCAHAGHPPSGRRPRGRGGSPRWRPRPRGRSRSSTSRPARSGRRRRGRARRGGPRPCGRGTKSRTWPTGPPGCGGCCWPGRRPRPRRCAPARWPRPATGRRAGRHVLPHKMSALSVRMMQPRNRRQPARDQPHGKCDRMNSAAGAGEHSSGGSTVGGTSTVGSRPAAAVRAVVHERHRLPGVAGAAVRGAWGGWDGLTA